MILFAIFCLVIFIQIFFYLYIFKNLKRCNSAVDPAFASPVSVVICARDEEDNLKVLLRHWLNKATLPLKWCL